MQTANVKQEAHPLVNHLPEDATWDDIMNRIYVLRQTIDAGLKDSNAGHVVDVMVGKITRRSEQIDVPAVIHATRI